MPTSFYHALQILHFLQAEGMWQPCIVRGWLASFSNNKKNKTRTVKHIGYFNTVQPTLLWSSVNPKYFSVISSHFLIPKLRLHSTLLYYFNSILKRRVTLLKSMAHTETKTSSTQNSSVVLHHSLDNPSVFPIIHRIVHKSLFMTMKGIFVLVLLSETWFWYNYKASSVFAPLLTLYVLVKPKRVELLETLQYCTTPASTRTVLLRFIPTLLFWSI